METKVAVLDSFHFVLIALLDDLAACVQGARLVEEAEHTFDISFALLKVPPSSTAYLACGLPTELPFITNPLHCSPTRSGKARD